MIRYSREFVLNGITEEDFGAWKHHPVTKLFMRFMMDYERALVESQIKEMRHVAIDPYRQGEYAGRANTLAELLDLTYGQIAEFYPTEEAVTAEQQPEEKDAA